MAEFSPRKTEMSDTVASDLLDDVIGQRGIREPVKSMLERAFRDLSKINPKWTRRRVRSIWDGEAARIEYREVAEMRAILNAREAHAKYQAETARMASFYLHHSTSGVGREDTIPSGLAGGMDCAGNQGAAR